MTNTIQLIDRLAAAILAATDPTARELLVDALAALAKQGAQDDAVRERRRERNRRYRETTTETASETTNETTIEIAAPVVSEPGPYNTRVKRVKAVQPVVPVQPVQQQPVQPVLPVQPITPRDIKPSLGADLSVGITGLGELGGEAPPEIRRKASRRATGVATGPGPALAYLRGVWQEIAGVVPIPMFNKLVSPALESHTAGAIERGMRYHVRQQTQRGRIVKLAWCMESLSVAIREDTEGHVSFLKGVDMATFGYLTAGEVTAAQEKAVQAKHAHDLLITEAIDGKVEAMFA